MKKPLPREGLTRPGPGEQDIPDMGPDVEGHGVLDQARLGIEQGLPGTPGSDSLIPNAPGSGDYKDDLGPDSV